MINKYAIGKKIGEGGFGEVRICIDKQTKQKRAVKFVKKDNLSRIQKQDILNEFKIMAGMNHPNIIQLYEFYEEPKHFCFVQEFLGGGDLLDAI